jgi:hypothetical protein
MGAGGLAGGAGAGGLGTGGMNGGCTIKPRMGCCFQDSDCAYLCYGSKCTDFGEGMCKDKPPMGQCWGDRDCPNGGTCTGATVCGCAQQCILPDKPGNCLSVDRP